MASVNQLPLIRSLFVWATQCCYIEFTATIYEDVIRGHLLDEAISSGWTIAVNKGSSIRNITVANGVVNETRSEFAAIAGFNPDVRVAAPQRLVGLLKVRGKFGSSKTRQIEDTRDDFAHVIAGRSDVFIVVADLHNYNLLRTGGAAITFANELPASPALNGQASMHVTSHNGAPAQTLAQIVPSTYGDRVVAAFFT